MKVIFKMMEDIQINWLAHLYTMKITIVWWEQLNRLMMSL